MSLALNVLLGLIVAYSSGSFAQDIPTYLYQPTGSCEVNQVCIYKYISEQQQFGTKQEQAVTVEATVETLCNSVGIYNESEATEYCMEIRQVSLSGSIFGSEQEKKDLENYAMKNLAGWFCFVQTAEGKVSSVYHESTENSEAINLKKSIVAAFQANFKGTEEEEEIDPQSKHISHYSYEPTEEDGAWKMHRSISTQDVEEYSGDTKTSDVELSKEEDVEYRSGSLYSSSGATSVEIVNYQRGESDNLTDYETFEVNANYRLDRVHCYSLSSEELPQRKRRSADSTNVVESTLSATIDKRSTSKEELVALKQQLPTTLQLLRKIHQEPKNIKLASKLHQLLLLEAEHGALPGTSPALTDVISYLGQLKQSTEDDEIKQTIHSLLAYEGSHMAQMALLNALLHGSEEEQESVITHIAFTQNAHADFVKQLEALLKKDSTKEDALILAYGALAGAASSSVQHRVMLFIKRRLVQQMALNDTSTTVHLLHALGNTGSKSITDLLFDYFSHSSSDEVKLAALGAARMITTHKPVQDAFIVILESDPEEHFVEEIAKTLLNGEEHNQFVGKRVKANNDLLNSLVTSSLSFKNNTDLHQLIQHYLDAVNTVESRKLKEFLEEQTGSGKRMRRASTTDWDASHSLYNLVASQSARRGDVRNYPRHRAYLWGRKLGTSKINVQLAAGIFAGGTIYKGKVFGRAIARGTAFGRSRTFAEAVAEARNSNNKVYVKLYAKIGSKVLINYSKTRSTCHSYTKKWHSSRFTILKFKYSVRIYVATVSFSVRLDAYLDVTIRGRLCLGKRYCKGSPNGRIALTPRVRAVPSGSASLTVLSVTRVGITISGTFNYQLEPAATVRVCGQRYKFQACGELHHVFPANHVDLYAWYQTRRLFGGWRSKKRCCISKKWRISKLKRSRIWRRCYP